MRSASVFVFIFISLALGSIILQEEEKEEPSFANNSTIFLIRHGEKPADDDITGLSEKGKKRAECLRKVFGAASPYKIGKIMAMTPKSDGRQDRPYLTVKPVAGDLRIKVDLSCDKEDTDCVKNSVKKWNDSPKGNILICWEHKMLKDIAKALGVNNAPDYPSDHFDLIWTIVNKKIVSITTEKCPGLDV